MPVTWPFLGAHVGATSLTPVAAGTAPTAAQLAPAAAPLVLAPRPVTQRRRYKSKKIKSEIHLKKIYECYLKAEFNHIERKKQTSKIHISVICFNSYLTFYLA